MPANLITAAEAEASWATFTSFSPARQAALLAAASDLVSARCNRILGFDTHDEVHRPGPMRILRVHQYPIIAITTIETGQPGSRVALAASDYALWRGGRAGEIELYRGFPAGYTYPDHLYGGHIAEGDVRVVYQAGYVAEADPAYPERPVCPPGLKEVVLLQLLIVGTTQTIQESIGLKSETLGQYTYTLDDASSTSTVSSTLPGHAEAILGLYRRKRFA